MSTPRHAVTAPSVAESVHCGPLLQYTLLHAVREVAPEAYDGAVAAAGFNADEALEIVHAGKLVHARTAVTLADLVARLPNAEAVFTRAGRTVFEISYGGVPNAVKTFLKVLPRRARIAFTLKAMKQMSYKFLGEGTPSDAWTGPNALEITTTGHLFSNSSYRICPGCAFYRAAFTRMFELFAKAPCRVEMASCAVADGGECRFRVTFT